jgi:aryl-alcohol dehydrogenase-like predicted oxidoreductase
MLQRDLGTSGLRISVIGLGTWAVGGLMWGGQDDRESRAAIEAAVDRGVTWIDTAPIYGSGRSEQIVGDTLRSLPASRRPMVFTKFGFGDNSDTAVKSATRPQVLAECEASLRRLHVDRIDLYQLHWPVPQPIAETAGACGELLRAGKIRAIGVSNVSVAQLEEWTATGVPLHAVQPPYSLFRPAAAADVLPWCAANGVGAIAYSPLFRGLLFGTWARDKTFPADDARSEHRDYLGARFQRHLDAVDELAALARSGGLSCPQLCIGVLLRTPGLTGCIVGARSARQGALIANLGVAVDDDQIEAARQVVARLQSDLEQLSGSG